MRKYDAPLLDCCLRLLQSQHATGDIVAEAAQLIAEEVGVNMRFHNAKSSASGEEMLEGIEVYESVAESLQAACVRFVADPPRERPLLLQELRRAREVLQNIVSKQ